MNRRDFLKFLVAAIPTPAIFEYFSEKEVGEFCYFNGEKWIKVEPAILLVRLKFMAEETLFVSSVGSGSKWNHDDTIDNFCWVFFLKRQESMTDTKILTVVEDFFSCYEEELKQLTYEVKGKFVV